MLSRLEAVVSVCSQVDRTGLPTAGLLSQQSLKRMCVYVVPGPLRMTYMFVPPCPIVLFLVPC